MADAFTPLAKGMNSEFANQNAYDSIQIHGGSGFMLEYKCQQLYRDARITSIYEGTTQLQTVAALRYVTNGTYLNIIKEFEAAPVAPEYEGDMNRIKEMANKLEATTNAVKEVGDQEFTDFCSRKLYEITAYTIMSHLILQDTQKAPALFARSLNVFVNHAESEVEKHFNYIRKMTVEQLDNYRHE